MSKITLQSGVKRIQVNENGDCITFDTRDQGFLAEMVALTKYFEAKRPEYRAKLAEIEAMPSGTQEEQKAKAQRRIPEEDGGVSGDHRNAFCSEKSDRGPSYPDKGWDRLERGSRSCVPTGGKYVGYVETACKK